MRTRPAIVLPMPLDVNAPRYINFGFQALARLKPGVTLAQANADVARMISILPPMFAQLELRPNVRPLAAEVIRDVGRILWILLAAVGVYSLGAYSVAQRTSEIGIRMTLGADRRRIILMILKESAALVTVGLAAGTLLAWAGARGAAGMLYGIQPSDPQTIAAAMMFLAVVASAASYLPARRASRASPVDALRQAQ